MRILFITGELNSGGAERQFLLNALALSDRHDVLIAIIGKNNSYEDFCKKNKLNIIKFNKPQGKIWNIYIILAISTFIIKNKIDIIHSFLSVPNLLAMVIAFFTRIDLVSSFRSSIVSSSNLWKKKNNAKLQNYNCEYSFIQKFNFFRSLTLHGIVWFIFIRIICNQSKFVYFNSSKSLKSHKKFFDLNSNNLFVIQNIVTNDFFKKLSLKETIVIKKKYNLLSNKKIFLCISRLVKEKNILFLIKSFIKLSNSSNSFLENKLIICGYGDQTYINIIKKLIKNYKNIELFHPRENIIELYQISDVFIFPSNWYEANPNVLLEAMACGLYIIVSKDADPLNLINEKNGSKFNSNNQNDLINKINHYNNNISREAINDILQKNKNFVYINYSFKIIKKKLNKLYEKYFLD